jgi:predicted nucleic acid-binding protein
VIRFWDTSALVKAYSPTERDHRDVLRRLHGRRARYVRQVTSMLTGLELVSALVRRTRDRSLARSALAQLDAFDQVEFGARHRDTALRLALSGVARGADTAIAAQALILAGAAVDEVEFLTADAAQARLVRREAQARGFALEVVELAA